MSYYNGKKIIGLVVRQGSSGSVDNETVIDLQAKITLLEIEVNELKENMPEFVELA